MTSLFKNKHTVVGFHCKQIIDSNIEKGRFLYPMAKTKIFQTFLISAVTIENNPRRQKTTKRYNAATSPAHFRDGIKKSLYSLKV